MPVWRETTSEKNRQQFSIFGFGVDNTASHLRMGFLKVPLQGTDWCSKSIGVANDTHSHNAGFPPSKVGVFYTVNTDISQKAMIGKRSLMSKRGKFNIEFKLEAVGLIRQPAAQLR
jgi:hypothetical protein